MLISVAIFFKHSSLWRLCYCWGQLQIIIGTAAVCETAHHAGFMSALMVYMVTDNMKLACTHNAFSVFLAEHVAFGSVYFD